MTENRSEGVRRTPANGRGAIGAGGMLAGRYRLDEPIGRGGMATVFHGHDELLDRDVAIKVLESVGASDSQEEFLREARAAAALTHPNIAGIYDAGVHGSQRYIVMEYVSGGSLAEIIANAAPLPIAQALSLARQIADALDFGHHRGIVHCDVKPQNVLLDDHRRAKLVDFGISRSVATTSALTETVTGTAGYIAPEQLLGERVDGRADVYSLGCVVYEMLTGDLPFEASTSAALATQRLVRPPIALRDRNPDIHPAVAEVVMRAIARDPDRRYQTAMEFSRALNRAQAEPARTSMSAARQPRSGWSAARQATVALPPPGERRRGTPEGARLIWPVALVCICIAILGIALAALQLPPFAAAARGSRTSMPQVVGERVDAAANQLHGGGLTITWELRDTTGSNVCTGTVLSQDPQSGTTVRAGSAVSVVISRNDKC